MGQTVDNRCSSRITTTPVCGSSKSSSALIKYSVSVEGFSKRPFSFYLPRLAPFPQNTLKTLTLQPWYVKVQGLWEQFWNKPGGIRHENTSSAQVEQHTPLYSHMYLLRANLRFIFIATRVWADAININSNAESIIH